MFCQNCGKQIPENAKFCNHCGATQGGNAAQGKPNTTQTNTQQQQHTLQRQPSQPMDEKEFKKYVTPYISRNIFLVMCGLTVLCLFVTPPGAFIWAIVAICFGIPWAVGQSRVNKQISYMQSGGTYEKMLEEFAVSSPILDGKVRYGTNYIFGKGSGCFLPYKDIYWVYRHNLSYLLIPIRSEAMIGNSKGRISSFCRLKRSNHAGGDEIKALAALIHSKNPNVILGFDDARQKEYKNRVS